MTTYENTAARQRLGVTDTIFQNYVTDMHTLFTSSGWAVASDTGQLDEATVTMPGLSTYAAPRLYYLDDSLHSTYPIYLKIEYGASTTQTFSTTRIGIGVATTGTGSVTGIGVSPIQLVPTAAASSNDAATVSTAPAYGSYGDGYSNVVLGDQVYGSSVNATSFISVSREFDQTTGALVSGGNFSVIAAGAGSTASAVSYAYSWDRSYSQRFGGQNSRYVYPAYLTSNPGSTIELFVNHVRFPQVAKLHTTATFAETDSAYNQTLTATILGSTPRTYRTIPARSPSGLTGFSLAMLWD